MKKSLSLSVSPEIGYDEELLAKEIQRKSGWQDAKFQILKRSVDARKAPVKIQILAEAYIQEDIPAIDLDRHYQDVSSSDEVIIVGAGPAGMFAALRLIELGLKPIILERGKDVQLRRRDLAAINKENIVNPDSNYCFGEGGAGTYSDGKLYTRSKKRGNIQRILETLVAHGAPNDILIEAHPHIGTNKLPKIVTALRESIQSAGGQFHFNSRVTGFIRSGSEIQGVKLADGSNVKGLAVILATGHSARDIFQLLVQEKIEIDIKSFALGVRIEHPQELIDNIQYHCSGPRDPHLPASFYSLVHQSDFKGKRRGVFSFCMCPGGFIVPAATSPGEVVVNGMSPSRRNSFFANSGIVVAVEESDFSEYTSHGPLAALSFQQKIEQKACEIAGGTQQAPAQRMMDFLHKRVSQDLPDCSYQPGIVSTDLREVLPEQITERLSSAFKYFGKLMKGYLTNEANIVGVESRTSSPVQIPRNKTTLEHVSARRLFPCGEGAGYAGGIVSAAMDGERCAEAVHSLYHKK